MYTAYTDWERSRSIIRNLQVHDMRSVIYPISIIYRSSSSGISSPGCLHLTPHHPGADWSPTVPAQQRRRSRKQHKHGQHTAQVMEFIVAPLVWLQSRLHIQGRHLRDLTSPRTPSDPSLSPDSPQQACDLRLAKLILRSGGPHAVGGPACRATGCSASTDSTMCMARAWPISIRPRAVQ
jgi:hypothetical protein